MNDMIIMPLAAPPKPAAQPPAPAETPEGGGASDFAAELNRQLAQINEPAPGPGRDAGKGRETGESAPETDATDEPTQEGQSAAPSRQAGADRLALAAQFLAVVTAAGDGAQAQAETVPGSNATAAAATAAVGSAAATVAPSTETMPAVTQAAPAAAAAPSQQVPLPAGAGDSPVTVTPGDPAVAATQAETVPDGQPVTVAASAVTGEPVAQSAGVGTASPTAVAVAATANSAGAQAAPAAVTRQAGGKAAEATAAPLSASEQQPPATEVAGEPMVSARAVARVADAADQNEAEQVTSAASESATTPADRMPAERGLAGRELTSAELAGDELASVGARPTDGITATGPAMSDRPALPQPVVSDVIGQMVAGAKLLRQGPVTEMRLQLKPEFLGRVDLKVTLTDGILSARILVDNPAVKAAIEANLSQLKQDLADQGIALQGMTVGLGGNHQEAADPRQSAFQRYLPQYRGGRESAPLTAGIAARRPVSAGNRLDLLL
ncbi:MAG: flagellar hook-length control protein FliK [Chloroflexota bacterium]